MPLQGFPARLLWSIPFAALVLVSGCVLSTDFSGTSFLCDQEPTCPDGFTCVDGRCVTGGGGSVDAGDGDGDGDGDGEDPDGGIAPPADFAFRQTLTFRNGGRADVTGLPVLVALNPSRFDYAAVREDGADIQFRDADDAVLPHEIEVWEPNGLSLVWVRVPLIAGGSDTDHIDLYYGDPEATGAEDPAGVWQAHQAVFHLDDEGPDVADASGNSFDGVEEGSSAADGFIGDGHRFEGGDYIDLGRNRDYLRAASRFTFEAWVHPEAAVDEVVFGASVNGDSQSRLEVGIGTDGVVQAGVRTRDVGGDDLVAVRAGDVLAFADWNWLTVVVDLGAGSIAIYIDGQLSQQVDQLFVDDRMPNTASAQATLGANESLDTGFFAGRMDEVRLSTEVLDGDRVAAEYASMVDQLIEFGAPEAP